MMQYSEALRRWGAARLEAHLEQDLPSTGPTDGLIDVESVTVRLDFNEGFACCGGRDEACACSYAESPRAAVAIEGRTSEPFRVRSFGGSERVVAAGWLVSLDIEPDDFDFATVLGEIVTAGGGAIGGTPHEG